MSSVETTVQDAINSEKFLSFSEVEQNSLLLMFAIYIDSANYWEANSEKWDKLLQGEGTMQLRSADDKKVDLWSADSKGAIAYGVGGAVAGGILGGIGGAVAGGVGGAAAGGVGAVPGAVGGAAAGAGSGSLIGALTGAISGAIGSSIYEYLGSIGGGGCSIGVPQDYNNYHY